MFEYSLKSPAHTPAQTTRAAICPSWRTQALRDSIKRAQKMNSARTMPPTATSPAASWYGRWYSQKYAPVVPTNMSHGTITKMMAWPKRELVRCCTSGVFAEGFIVWGAREQPQQRAPDARAEKALAHLE